MKKNVAHYAYLTVVSTKIEQNHLKEKRKIVYIKCFLIDIHRKYTVNYHFLIFIDGYD